MDITEMGLGELRFVLYALLGLLALTVVALAFYLGRSFRAGRTRPAPPPPGLEADLSGLESPALPSIRLEREPGSDRLVVEVQGQRYRRLSEIGDAELRRQVMEAAAEMVDFAGVVGAGEPTLLPPDAALRWQEDLRRAMPRQGAAKFLEQAAREAGAEEVVPVTLAGALQRALGGKAPDSPQALSLVEEIDQIVQRRLTATQGLQGRSLHLRSTDGERIVYEFEGAEYASLDEIPNHTARLLVQDAIREWEETR